MNQYSGYFDYASATPLDDAVFDVLKPYMAKSFYNPSALYAAATDVRVHIDEARSKVAEQLGAKAQEIIFTSGCTESNNLAIDGIMSQYPGGKLLISAIEHDSVREVAKQYKHATLPVDKDGMVDMEKLTAWDLTDVVLISVMYANNEVGAIQPLREIGKVVEQERKRRGPKGMPIYFHTDAAQASNYLKLKVDGLKVDLMSLNGGKMYGPKGSGCLYVASHMQLQPIQRGGGQERGLRSGTEHVSAIVGFAEALVRAQSVAEIESERLRVLQEILIGSLESMGGTINGGLKKRLPNNVNVRFRGIDNERLVIELDALGYMISSGSACHAKSGEPSAVLAALGLSPDDARSSVRITLGRYTTQEDVENFALSIASLVAKNR